MPSSNTPAANEQIYPAIHMTAEIVSAHVANNPVPISELATLIRNVHETIQGIQKGTLEEEQKQEVQKPAVSIRRSVTDDHIVCLDCGLKFKTLRRHLTSAHGMTSDEYREKWNLSHDYPMVAPAYSKFRQEMATKIGLGRKAKKTRKQSRKKSD